MSNTEANFAGQDYEFDNPLQTSQDRAPTTKMKHNKLAQALWNGLGFAFEEVNFSREDAEVFSYLIIKHAHKLYVHGSEKTGKGFEVDINDPANEVVQATASIFEDITTENGNLD